MGLDQYLLKPVRPYGDRPPEDRVEVGTYLVVGSVRGPVWPNEVRGVIGHHQHEQLVALKRVEQAHEGDG